MVPRPAGGQVLNAISPICCSWQNVMVVAAIQIHATKVVFDWEIRILQSNAKSGNGFHLGEIRPHSGFHL